MTLSLNEAISMAAIAHQGQYDKQGEPYILHPLAVMARMSDNDSRIVAVLHDTIEDTETTEADVRALCEPHVADAIVALTRRGGESYMAFIDRVIAAGPLAVRVKLADIAENMRPDRRHPDVDKLLPRYKQAKERILSAVAAKELP